MNRQPTKMLWAWAFFMAFYSPIFAQSSYNDYRSLDKIFKYRQDFNASSGYWETYSKGKSESQIRGGALVFKSINDRAQVKYVRIADMDWSGDWELEIGVRWVSGKENSSVDLVWDRSPKSSRKYHFGFTAGRKYNIAEYVDGYEQIVGFTPADFVYRATRNRMTVRHVKGYYYFFVNERFVKKSRAKTITGEHVGFMVPPGSVIEVDYLYARQLKKKVLNGQRTGYIGVMTKYTGLNQQRYKTRENFPKEEIKSDWNAGYNISGLSYDNNEWTLISSKGTGYSTQTWMTRREWNKEDIKEKWNQGYLITEVSYGNGVYAIVFSKTTALGRQRWATKLSGFPSDKIREFGKEGLVITKVVYGKDRWVLVATVDNRIKNQKWFKRARFPAEDIENYTVQGYTITQLSQEDGWWVLVMSQYHSGDKPTVWFRAEDFPKDQIRKYWDQGYYLTEISYAKPSKRPAPSNFSAPSTNSTNTEPKATPANKRWDLKAKLSGQWYGGASGEEKGYMTFYNDDILKMVSGDETIGGYDFTQDGVKIDVKYELNSFNTPNQLDIVFYSKGNAFGRMKGIIRFKDNDTFELKLANGFNDPRPTSFTSTAKNKVATFRRVD